MTLTYLDAADAYEITVNEIAGPNVKVTIIRYRGMMDGPGDEVSYDDLPPHIQQGIRNLLVKEFRQRKLDEEERREAEGR